MHDDPEDYYLPLTDQRVFGAGIKRKRVPFVPASTTESKALEGSEALSTKSAGARYLEIVLPKPKSETDPCGSVEERVYENDLRTGCSNVHDSQLCPICSQPVDSDSPEPIQHQSSIRHQLALPHVHPPSHLPRDHPGLKYLSSYGWDPDSRSGLGAQQQGIRQPIKAQEKRDTTGLREMVDEDDGQETTNGKTPRELNKDRSPVRLNAKQARQQALVGKKKAAELHEKFYGRIDVDEYLGS